MLRWRPLGIEPVAFCMWGGSDSDELTTTTLLLLLYCNYIFCCWVHWQWRYRWRVWTLRSGKQNCVCTKWAGQWSAGAWSLSWLHYTVSHTLHTVSTARRVMCPTVSCLYGFCHCVASPALIFLLLLLLHFTLVSFHCRSSLPIKTRLTTMRAAPPASGCSDVFCRTLQHKRRITALRGQCCLSHPVSSLVGGLY